MPGFGVIRQYTAAYFSLWAGVFDFMAYVIDPDLGGADGPINVLAYEHTCPRSI